MGGKWVGNALAVGGVGDSAHHGTTIFTNSSGWSVSDNYVSTTMVGIPPDGVRCMMCDNFVINRKICSKCMERIVKIKESIRRIDGRKRKTQTTKGD